MSRKRWKEEERSRPTFDVRRRAFHQGRLMTVAVQAERQLRYRPRLDQTSTIFCGLPSSTMFALVSDTALTAETMPMRRLIEFHDTVNCPQWSHHPLAASGTHIV